MMTNQECQKLIKELRRLKKSLDTPEKSLKFLVDAGICAKTGKLSKNYR